MQKDLIITNPSLGGSGYLTLVGSMANAATKAGYYSAIYQCRGLAQAEGPMCLDIWISTKEIYGAVPQEINYMNGYDMTEIWRMFLEAGSQAEKVYSKDLTLIMDYKVIEPIAVTTNMKGPRYYTREELLEVLKEYKIAGSAPRLIVYDFSKYRQYASVLKGPYSFGVIIADLEKRNDIIKLPKKESEEAVREGAPQSGKIPQLNVEAFQRGYKDRSEANEGKVLMI